MMTEAATSTSFSRLARAGMDDPPVGQERSVQAFAETADAGAGFPQALGVGRVADPDVPGCNEGGAVHGGYPLLLEQGGHEILVRLDAPPARRGLAETAMNAREHVECPLRPAA